MKSKAKSNFRLVQVAIVTLCWLQFTHYSVAKPVEWADEVASYVGKNAVLAEGEARVEKVGSDGARRGAIVKTRCWAFPKERFCIALELSNGTREVISLRRSNGIWLPSNYFRTDIGKMPGISPAAFANNEAGNNSMLDEIRYYSPLLLTLTNGLEPNRLGPDQVDSNDPNSLSYNIESGIPDMLLHSEYNFENGRLGEFTQSLLPPDGKILPVATANFTYSLPDFPALPSEVKTDLFLLNQWDTPATRIESVIFTVTNLTDSFETVVARESSGLVEPWKMPSATNASYSEDVQSDILSGNSFLRTRKYAYAGVGIGGIATVLMLIAIFLRRRNA